MFDEYFLHELTYQQELEEKVARLEREIVRNRPQNMPGRPRQP
jgi:hypothetical protein